MALSSTLCYAVFLLHVSLSLGRFSFIRLAQPFTVSMFEGCVVQWKGQMLRLFLPRRALPTSLSMAFALGSILVNFSSIIPVFLAWHCVFHAPASFDATCNSLPRWMLALAPIVDILCVDFSCGISASRSRDLVVCIRHSFFLLILTSRCGVQLNSGDLQDVFFECTLFMGCSIKASLSVLWFLPYCSHLPTAVQFAFLLLSTQDRQGPSPWSECWTHHLLSSFAALMNCEDGFLV